MAATKNLYAQISLDLHQKISEAKERSGLTTAQYITNLFTEYFKMKKSGGNITMMNNITRTLACQISEDLFQRIKAHLESVLKLRYWLVRKLIRGVDLSKEAV